MSQKSAKLPKVWQKWILLALMLLAIVAVYFARAPLTPFFISLFIVYLFAPVVDFICGLKFFKQKNFSRSFSVTVIYILIMGILLFITSMVIPRLYYEILRMTQDLPHHFKFIRTEVFSTWIPMVQQLLSEHNINIDVKKYIFETIANTLKSGEIQLAKIPASLPIILKGLFDYLTAFLIMFIFTAIVLGDLPQMKKKIFSLVPSSWRDEAVTLLTAINKDFSGAIRGQLLICLVNGILTSVFLLIFKVKYAMTIGIISGVLSFIPVFGAIMTVIPAVLITLAQSWQAVIAVIVVMIIINLIEANYLNPKIMGDNVELHPAVIITVIVLGEYFFKTAGLILAVPVTAMARSVIRHFYLKFFDVEEEETKEKKSGKK